MHCTYCGKEIKEGEECLCRQTAAAKKPNPKKMAAIIAAVIGAAIIVIICLLSVPSKSKIDPFKYVEVTYSGFDSNGEADIYFDTDALICSIIGEEPGFSSLSKLEKWYTEYEAYEENIECIYSKTEGLSNGDSITVTIKVTGAAKDKITSGEKTYKVSGLQEGKTIDLFAPGTVELTFTGYNGNGKATLKENVPEELDCYVYYNLSENSGLSNGDLITVEVSVNKSGFTENGYCVPNVTEKIYTVSGLPVYYTLNGEFPAELLAANKASAAQMVNEQVSNLHPGEKLLNGPEYIKTYFLQAKDISAPYQDWFRGVEFVNAVCVVEKYTLDLGWGGVYRTYWYGYLFQEYYVDSNGTIAYNTENEQHFCFVVDSLEEFEAALKNECDMMNIAEIG